MDTTIKNIFFDLDNTLWNFQENSRDTLLELINKFKLTSRGVDNAENFIRKYQLKNDMLWSLYRNNKITKEELRSKRFLLTLQEYGINDEKLSEDFGSAYIKESPLIKKLFPFANQTLNYLKDKYSLHIITNGFEEVQYIKLNVSGLTQYFDQIITSEKVGVKKPHKEIFHYALNITNAKAEESVMIGDDLEADIHGSKKIGMQAIYFNPKKSETIKNQKDEIYCLSEIMKIL